MTRALRYRELRLYLHIQANIALCVLYLNQPVYMMMEKIQEGVESSETCLVVFDGHIEEDHGVEWAAPVCLL